MGGGGPPPMAQQAHRSFLEGASGTGSTMARPSAWRPWQAASSTPAAAATDRACASNSSSSAGSSAERTTNPERVKLRVTGHQLPLPGGELIAGRLLLGADPEPDPAALLLVRVELGGLALHRPARRTRRHRLQHHADRPCHGQGEQEIGRPRRGHVGTRPLDHVIAAVGRGVDPHLLPLFLHAQRPSGCDARPTGCPGQRGELSGASSTGRVEPLTQRHRELGGVDDCRLQTCCGQSIGKEIGLAEKCLGEPHPTAAPSHSSHGQGQKHLVVGLAGEEVEDLSVGRGGWAFEGAFGHPTCGGRERHPAQETSPVPAPGTGAPMPPRNCRGTGPVPPRRKGGMRSALRPAMLPLPVRRSGLRPRRACSH